MKGSIRKIRIRPRRKGHTLPQSVAHGNPAAGKAFEEEAEAAERISYRVYGKMKARALYAGRMAGRQSLFDLFSIVETPGRVRLISCKTDGYIRPRERQALAEFLSRLPAVLVPVLEVHYRKGGKIHRKTIRTAKDLEFFAHKGRDTQWQ